jgi:hypothetical protein
MMVVTVMKLVMMVVTVDRLNVMTVNMTGLHMELNAVIPLGMHMVLTVLH